MAFENRVGHGVTEVLGHLGGVALNGSVAGKNSACEPQKVCLCTAVLGLPGHDCMLSGSWPDRRCPDSPLRPALCRSSTPWALSLGFRDVELVV